MTQSAAVPLPEWGAKGLVEQFISECSAMEDLEPEDFTDEEKEKVDALRRGVLEKLGMDAPPKHNYLAHVFQRGALVRFLRGRNWKVKKSIKMLADAVQWYRDYPFLGTIQNYEAKFKTEDYIRQEAYFQKYFCQGFHGVDRRGAAVLYLRHGLLDLKGIVKHTSLEYYLEREVYGASYFWSHLYRESLLVNKWLLGRVFVCDLKGFSWSRIMGVLSIGRKLQPVMVDHFPEGALVIIVCNAPWYFASLWALVSPLLPARTREKVKVFRGSGYLEAISEYVSLDQVPQFLGGSSPLPWAYGEGGDLPK